VNFLLLSFLVTKDIYPVTNFSPYAFSISLGAVSTAAVITVWAPVGMATWLVYPQTVFFISPTIESRGTSNHQSRSASYGASPSGIQQTSHWMHHKQCYSNEAFLSLAANFNIVFFQLREMRNSLAYSGRCVQGSWPQHGKGALLFFMKPATPHIIFNTEPYYFESGAKCLSWPSIQFFLLYRYV
jgi:hypothetical protein